jgi:hypothetical protein
VAECSVGTVIAAPSARVKAASAVPVDSNGVSHGARRWTASSRRRVVRRSIAPAGRTSWTRPSVAVRTQSSIVARASRGAVKSVVWSPAP